MILTIYRLKIPCFALLVTLITSSQVLATEAKGLVRILTVGNSFTNNATELLGEVAESRGRKLIHKRLHIGGSSLKKHHGLAVTPTNPIQGSGTPYSNGETLTEALKSEDWDFVTLQQLSIKSHNASTYEPYISNIAQLIHRFAPQAELVIHQTWAYRCDDPRFSKSLYQEGEPRTQEEMYQGLARAYAKVAHSLNAKIIPTGNGFWRADNDPKYRYQPAEDAAARKFIFPELPNQTYSLHKGYNWKKKDGQNRLNMDGHHTSLAGKYLAACIWYSCLFADNPELVTFRPDEISADYAAFLRKVAKEVTEQQSGTLSGKSIRQKRLDSDPKRYQLVVRASEVDPEIGEYPSIAFTRGTDDRPNDLQHASVDTRYESKGKLVLWLMSHNEELFERLNQYGMHAMSVHYARGWFSKLCQPQPATPLARGQVRLEAATGLDQSDELNLQYRDGAAERTRRFLIWLHDKNPSANWDQFLTPDFDRVRWDKVIVSGASHGSTTAARFAKYQRVDRVVMLCGPRDQDQDWQELYSATPESRFFGFSHVLDGGWTGDHYCRSWQLLRMNRFGPIIDVGESSPPYSHTRRLISNANVEGDARKAHSAVTPGRASPRDTQGNYLYEPVWRYLYTSPIERFGDAVAAEVDCNLNQ